MNKAEFHCLEAAMVADTEAANSSGTGPGPRPDDGLPF